MVGMEILKYLYYQILQIWLSMIRLLRPDENDKPSVAQVAHFHFTEYVDKFDEISRLLSYETVISGNFLYIQIYLAH